MPNPPVDLLGQTFDCLTVIAREGTNNKKATWRCRCKCGNEVVLESQSLRSKHRKHHSCGCQWGRWNETHGLSRKHPLYNRWSKMRSRCLRPVDKDYSNYGERGIQVCKRWNDFQNFVADMGSTFSEGLTLDRIDVNGPYSPENCRWTTVQEQSNNTRYNILIPTPDGDMTVAQAAKIYNIKPVTIYARIKRGWPPERLLESTT